MRKYYIFKCGEEWIVWRPASEIYVALDWADAVDYVRACVDAGA